MRRLIPVNLESGLADSGNSKFECPHRVVNVRFSTSIQTPFKTTTQALLLYSDLNIKLNVTRIVLLSFANRSTKPSPPYQQHLGLSYRKQNVPYDLSCDIVNTPSFIFKQLPAWMTDGHPDTLRTPAASSSVLATSQPCRSNSRKTL